jgi:hypothetical protein
MILWLLLYTLGREKPVEIVGWNEGGVLLDADAA